MCDLVQDRFRRQMQPRPGWQRVEKQELVPRKEAAERKLAQKEAENAKTQQGVQEDDTELTVEDLD